MKELAGRVAVITGGGSGIGAALARACAAEGMRLMLADVEPAAAERVAAGIREGGGEALSAAVDVRDAASLEALAARTFAELGGCHLLANNAGVALFRRAAEMELADWEWVVSVNLMGVVHGISAFLPRLRAQGAPAHIVNTASIAGLIAMGDAGLAAYTASKFGVVGLSEVLRQELAADCIGVSVVCPGGVATRITDSERNRPEALRTAATDAARAAAAASGDASSGDLERREGILSPEAVAADILHAVREDLPYVLTHPDWRALVEQRHAALEAAFEAAAARRSR